MNKGPIANSDVIVYVADAGSMSKGNFCWVSSRRPTASSSDVALLADDIARDLIGGHRVALGFECPLFMPCELDPQMLGRARSGECQPATGNRPFTAGAGASSLVIGTQTLAWALRQIAAGLAGSQVGPLVTTSWDDFRKSPGPSLLLWEAFVSGSEKASPPSHAEDAVLAMEAFREAVSTPSVAGADATRITCDAAFSLAGAAILWAGLSKDSSLLHSPCVVLRPLSRAGGRRTHDDSTT
jgi:hypothetical protein